MQTVAVVQLSGCLPNMCENCFNSKNPELQHSLDHADDRPTHKTKGFDQHPRCIFVIRMRFVG